MSDPPRAHENEQDTAEAAARVRADYQRISQAREPYLVLNLEPGTAIAQVRVRYHQFEKFYRVDKFLHFADSELVRQVLEIRRAVGRAMVAINSDQRNPPTAGGSHQDSQVDARSLEEVDRAALGDIYFRDGLTYLKLRDLNSAEEFLNLAVEHDPTRGILLAYRSYARFKLRANDPLTVEECGAQLEHAAQMDAQNVEIYVLIARFGINIEDVVLATGAIAKIEALRPEYSKLAKLESRLARVKAQFSED